MERILKMNMPQEEMSTLLKQADEAYEAKNYAEAFALYNEAAEQGNAHAQDMLGDMYYYGKGVEQDYAKALEWYKESARQGNDWAQYSLGVMYFYGKGVAQDYTKALERYNKSAEQDHTRARNYLERIRFKYHC